MHDRDIDGQIKNYRKKQEIFLNDNCVKKYCFINPTQETPVETSQVLRFMDLSWTDPILKQLFPRFEIIKHRLYPRIKLVLFMKLRPDLRKVSELYRVILSSEEIARNLGFDPYSLPCYETIRHFINDLLDDNTMEQVFYREVMTIEQELGRSGERLGEKTMEDATIITAKRGDPEAEYNGYYDDWGWKKDLLLDQKHKVFLAYHNLGVNETEGHALPSNLEKLQEINIHIDEITADGRYPTYENIAVTKHQYSTDLFYRPQKDWVHNTKGDFCEINHRYQKYWKHPDFKVNADLGYKLHFLYQKGDLEWVGAYYRNQHVQWYNSRIKRCKKRYRTERNTNESFNNYLKQHMGFETSLPQKGRKQAFKHTTLCLIAINAVALTRLQNGETKNLTSIACLT